jgi:hypothetical protein
MTTMVAVITIVCASSYQKETSGIKGAVAE